MLESLLYLFTPKAPIIPEEKTKEKVMTKKTFCCISHRRQLRARRANGSKAILEPARTDTLPTAQDFLIGLRSTRETLLST